MNIEFWGASYNKNSTNYTGYDTYILPRVATMLATDEFWLRYSQYGVTSGLASGAAYRFGDAHNLTLSDSVIEGDVAVEISNGTVPYGANNIYLIFLPDDLEATSAASSTCTGPTAPGSTTPSCPGTGFHRQTTVSQGPVTIAVVQEAASSANCNQDCVNAINSMTAAHEVMEAATDPGANGYSSPIPKGAPVVDNNTLEIGDLCNAIGEPVNGVWWQQSWLQDQCRCDGDGTPGTLWQAGFGYTGQPIGDWMLNSYKGQCAQGQPVTGLSEYTSGLQPPVHDVLCGNGPGYVDAYSQSSSCYSLAFNTNNKGAPDPWPYSDWDPGYYKAQCRANEFVAGVSESQTGFVDGILCCPGSVTQQSCQTEVFWGGTPNAFVDRDWDPGFYKGMCPSGKYVAGVSAWPSNPYYPPYVAHAIDCCSP